jgi:hypothetical protein
MANRPLHRPVGDSVEYHRQCQATRGAKIMIASGNLRNAEYRVLNAGRDSSEQAAEPTISAWAGERVTRDR